VCVGTKSMTNDLKTQDCCRDNERLLPTCDNNSSLRLHRRRSEAATRTAATVSWSDELVHHLDNTQILFPRPHHHHLHWKFVLENNFPSTTTITTPRPDECYGSYYPKAPPYQLHIIIEIKLLEDLNKWFLLTYKSSAPNNLLQFLDTGCLSKLSKQSGIAATESRVQKVNLFKGAWWGRKSVVVTQALSP